MQSQKKSRRSGLKIMASLVVLLGSLAYIMVGAIVNGVLGFMCSMGVTLFGAIGIAKVLGETIAMDYSLIITLAIACGVLRGVLRYVEQYFNHYIAFRLLAVLRDKIFTSLRVLSPAKLETKQKGSIIAMITSDIETLEVFYAHTISPIFIAVLMSVIVCIAVGMVSSWYLSLVALLGYLGIGVVVPMISSRALKESGMKYRNEFASFNAYFLDSIKGIKDIVFNNAGAEREKEVNARSEKLLQETKIMRDNSTRAAAATELTVTFFSIIALVVGILLVNSAVITIGRMVIGMVTVFSSFGPVIAVAALPANLTQTFASGERVLNLLQEKPVVEEVTGKENIAYDHLTINNLSFGYDDTTVLDTVSMKARKGEIVGIVGESGCGKSTLLTLLLRFWQKDDGEILYNGIDVDDVNTDSLLENITMVSQTTYLFDMSIEDNLRIAKQNATQEELEEACNMASIHDFIRSLPNGYKTQVGALGDHLSAGEKQRIGLARAFLRGSELILLDEPTSNVDSINEGIILKALLAQKRKKSIILVSHRESTMAIADRIYKIDNGKMAEVI